MRVLAIRKALLIDDDEGVFENISSVLNKSFDPRIELIHAPNPKTGFTSFFSEEPDIVFLDIHFSEIEASGIDLLKRIKQVQISENIPFILLSDRESIVEHLKDLAEEYLPDDFLAKPLPSVELAAKIRQWDRTLYAERKLISSNEYLEKKASDLAKDNLAAVQQLSESHSISTMGLFSRGLLTIFSDTLLNIRGYAQILKMNSNNPDYLNMISADLANELLSSTSAPRNLLNAVRIYFEGSLEGWETVNIYPIVEGLTDLVNHELRKDGLRIIKDFSDFGTSKVIPAYLVQSVISLFLVFRNCSIPGAVMTVKSLLEEDSIGLQFIFQPKKDSRTMIKDFFLQNDNPEEFKSLSPSTTSFALKSALDTAKRTNGTISFSEGRGASCLTLMLPVFRD